MLVTPSAHGGMCFSRFPPVGTLWNPCSARVMEVWCCASLFFPLARNKETLLGLCSTPMEIEKWRHLGRFQAFNLPSRYNPCSSIAFWACSGSVSASCVVLLMVWHSCLIFLACRSVLACRWTAGCVYFLGCWEFQQRSSVPPWRKPLLTLLILLFDGLVCAIGYGFPAVFTMRPP